MLAQQMGGYKRAARAAAHNRDMPRLGVLQFWLLY
jgi:hypothetical protein